MAAVGTLVMAFHANRPFAQAPGTGLNASFAFTVEGARQYVARVFTKPVEFSVAAGSISYPVVKLAAAERKGVTSTSDPSRSRSSATSSS